MKIYDKLVKKEAKLAVVGLGYVGLPIALEFAKKLSVIGYDIDENKNYVINEKEARNCRKCACEMTRAMNSLLKSLKTGR